ncbi:MAG: hypothetical protein JW808_03865 [Victivallales bacterium]|nr:hypothetical protein [Victivallales bacterium]
MSDEIAKMRLKRNVALCFAALFLAGLIVYGVARPDPEEKIANELKEAILTKDPRDMTREEREQMREMIENLSPETRKKLVREVMRGRLEQMREETKELTEEQKRERIDEAVQNMRERFSKMTSEQRAEARERMNSAEGRERMGEALDFFYNEFTPEERQLLDPLVEEFSMQMERR